MFLFVVGAVLAPSIARAVELRGSPKVVEPCVPAKVIEYPTTTLPVEAPPPPSAPAPAPEPFNPYPFAMAKKCSDCYYKGDKCGCKPAMEYMACVTKWCGKSDSETFHDKCVTFSNQCFGELDVKCSGAGTTCEGKFNQLPAGGLGLSLLLDGAEEDAYCGPFGKCIGKIHMAVEIHGTPDSDVWMECGLPNTPAGVKPDIEKHDEWVRCGAKVTGQKAACDIPMFPKLPAGGSKAGYCFLTEGKNGCRITQPAWHSVANKYKEPVEPAPPAAKKPAAPKKVAPAPAAPEPEPKPEPEPEPKPEPKPATTAKRVTVDVDDHPFNPFRPAWMKNSDAEEKPPPPHEQAASALADSVKNDPVAKAVSGAINRDLEEFPEATAKSAKRVRDGSNAAADEVEKDLEQTRLPRVYDADKATGKPPWAL